MAKIYQPFELSCPKCTFLNPDRPKNCSMCNYEFKTRTLESINQNNNEQIDPNNNKNKIYNSINAKFNDVKQFLSSINNQKNSDRQEVNLDDSVIEIDPESNKTVLVTNDNFWECKTCTFATNPNWSIVCDICNAKRDIKPAKSAKNNSILYDKTLNEDIYDYARIWTCSECTFINFDQDEKCELCNSPRQKTVKSSSPTEKKNAGDIWVCKLCTYINSDKRPKCGLCNANKNGKIENNPWSCDACGIKNNADTNRCGTCSLNKSNSAMETYNNDYDNNYPTDYNNFMDASKFTSLTSRSHKAKSLIKQYTNATNEAEKVWKNIVKYCKQNNHKFVDDSFPPCDKSLFIDPKKKPKNLGSIQWLSPEQIQTHSNERHLKWSVYNEPKFNDIKQGLLGNCWLLSGLAVILEQPELLKRIIITKEYCPQGCYQVRLCKNGEWQTVILDDLFPCDQNGYLIYSQANRKQLWVPLIEKAMAKLNGSYESLIAGQTVEGLSALTGYPCDCIRLEPSSSNEEEIDLEMIWARMLSMKEAGYALGASCGKTVITDDKIFKDKGLLPRHAYSVLAVKEVNGNRLIQLRNPWGKLKFKNLTMIIKRYFLNGKNKIF